MGNENVMDLIWQNGELLFLAFIFVSIILALIILGINMLKLWNLHKNLERVNPGAETFLKNLLSEVEGLKESLNHIETRLTHQEELLPLCLKKVGLVRYKAFDYVGGDQSFSIALLDDNKNGFVISGISGIDECRVYAKPLVNGTSSYNLSAEEKEAIKKAMTT
jgi:hypothetical protein